MIDVAFQGFIHKLVRKIYICVLGSDSGAKNSVNVKTDSCVVKLSIRDGIGFFKQVFYYDSTILEFVPAIRNTTMSNHTIAHQQGAKKAHGCEHDFFGVDMLP